MRRFEIESVFASAIPEAAQFLRKQETPEVDSRVRGASGKDIISIERRLKWLLLDNPSALPESPRGFCIRDSAGGMRGLSLFYPSTFVCGDRKLQGLGSGSYFVEHAARTMGFYIFKKYLAIRGYSFFFTTSCNPNSAPLWETLGGCSIAHSELEYIVPLNVESLLAALLSERMPGGLGRASARVLGWAGNAGLRSARRAPTALRIEPCRDWQKLSALFQRFRSKDCITADRSPEYLEWRYGQSSDPHPSGVYSFRDPRGVEGWFALGEALRGRYGQIRASVLLDVVRPVDKIRFNDILTEVVHLASARSQILLVHPRWAMRCRVTDWVIRRRRSAASSFVVVPKGDSEATAATLDLTFADGDCGLPCSVAPRPEGANWRTHRVSFHQPVGR